MNVCNLGYCDFFLWLKNDNYYERITRDLDIWHEYTAKAETVFRNGILPELLGKVFTRVPKLLVNDNLNMEQFCYCKGSIKSQLYPCSKSTCERKKFHLECLNLKNAVKKRWVCSDCRNVNINNKSNKNNN